MDRPNRTVPLSRFPWIASVVLTVLALGLRLYRLGFQALFLDEYGSWRISSVPGFGEFLRTVWLHEANPPLHFILLRAWMALFGDSEISLRMPSVLFGTATVWVMMRVAWDARFRGRFALFLAGLLPVVSPYALYYSQEARAYAMLLFLAALILLFVVRIWMAPERPAWGDVVGLVATGLVAALTHYFALFPIVFAGVAVFVRRLGAIRRGGVGAAWEARSAVAWGAAVVLSVAVFLMAVVLPDTSALIAWLPPWDVTALYSHWKAVAEGPLLRACPVWMVWVALGFWIAAMALAAVSAWLGRVRRAGSLLCLSLLVIAITGLFPHVVSAFRSILFDGQRYMIVFLPAFWFTVVFAASVVRWQWLFGAFVLAFMLCRPGWYLEYYGQRHKRAWDEIGAICQSNLQAGDTVWYLAQYGRGPLLYYLRDSGLEVASRKTPGEMPAPPAGAKRLAVAARAPFVVSFPPPRGFAAEGAYVVGEGRPRVEACVVIFRRVGTDGR